MAADPVKKSLEFDYPRLQGGALRRIHGYRHRDFVIRLKIQTIHPRLQNGVFWLNFHKYRPDRQSASHWHTVYQSYFNF